MTSADESLAARLNRKLAESGLASLDLKTAAQLESYLALLLRWNARINLTSIRDEEGILARHFVESIACAQTLPMEIRTLLDFGSGAGLPGIPIALCRADIFVTLAESQGRKAAFLQEAIRVLGLRAHVHSGRAEKLNSKFDCVILRAVDHMGEAVSIGGRLVADGGWLALMTSVSDLERLRLAAGPEFDHYSETPLPGSNCRVLALVKRQVAIL